MPARSFRIGTTLAGVALLLAAVGCSTGGTPTADPGASISSSSTSSSSTPDTSSSDSSSPSTSTSDSSTSSTPESSTPESSTSESSTSESSTEDTTSSAPESITTPSIAPSETSTTEPRSSEPPTSDAPLPTSSKPSGSSTPGGKLDPATVNWFNNGCAIQKQLRSLASPKTSGSLTNIKGQVSTAYSLLSTTGTVGKARLSSTPAPTFPGGATFKAAQLARMQAIADGYGAGSKSIAAATFTTPAELKAAIEKIEAGVEAAVNKAVATAPGLPEDLRTAVKALPACVGVN